MIKIETFDQYSEILKDYELKHGINLYFKWQHEEHYKILSQASDEFLMSLTAQRLRFADRMGNYDGIEDDFIEQEFQKLKKQVEKYR